MLREYLNEFELDQAFAPVRSEQIEAAAWKDARVWVIGEDNDLAKRIVWSFMAWNDKKNLGITVSQKLAIPSTGENVDYVIFTGFCGAEIHLSAQESREYLQNFLKQLQKVKMLSTRRVLLLSDGRMYGQCEEAFLTSEYEMGDTDTEAEAFDCQYFLQALESIFVSVARMDQWDYNILRTGLVYGAGICPWRHPLMELVQKVVDEETCEVPMEPQRSSYISVHDLLTAVQFVLIHVPKNKIFNVKGRDSDASLAELTVMLARNFPERCRISLKPAASSKKDAVLLNTQLIEHYGFSPAISLENGLIILVKSLLNTGEVFIFDNTYMGKLQKVQDILLAYLLEIDRICKKHNIHYFLAGGTLLGAIRHHGFIPWDDDADVMMLREDYDRFLKVVEEEMPDNLFLQLPKTEKGNHNAFAKLRINDTLFATKFTGQFLNLHNGIFFDVLAQDQTSDRKWAQKLHIMFTMLTRSVVFNKWGNSNIASGGAHPILCKIIDKVKYLVPMRFAERMSNKALTFYKGKRSSYLIDGMGRNLSRGVFPKAWLEETIYVDFEGYSFPVPKEYDAYLTYLYGDYMQMIPVSERRTSHSIVMMDLGQYSGYTRMKE